MTDFLIIMLATICSAAWLKIRNLKAEVWKLRSQIAASVAAQNTARDNSPVACALREMERYRDKMQDVRDCMTEGDEELDRQIDDANRTIACEQAFLYGSPARYYSHDSTTTHFFSFFPAAPPAKR